MTSYQDDHRHLFQVLQYARTDVGKEYRPVLQCKTCLKTHLVKDGVLTPNNWEEAP